MLVCSSGLTAIPTNVPPQFITQPGQERFLKPPWVGKAKLAVQTGWYVTNQGPPEIRAQKEQIRFDWVFIGKEPMSNTPSLKLGQSYGWSQGRPSMVNVHSYRDTLPSDTEIKGCETVSQLNALLGFPQWADGAPYNAQWRYFSIGPSNSVETLTVFCTAFQYDRGKGPLDSLEIWRGVAQESKAPLKR